MNLFQSRRRTGGPRGKEAGDLLLAEHGICIQPINCPAVLRGTEWRPTTPGQF
jgi:5-aminolevulinate synthase